MKPGIGHRFFSLMATTLVALLLTATSTFSQEDKRIPGMLDLSKVKITIYDVAFVAELQGSNGAYNETQLDKYHGAVITLAITKEPGSSLTLHAQDLVLHYRRGEDSYDVAKCIGLSSFSSSLDVDRPMTFYNSGLGKMVTGELYPIGWTVLSQFLGGKTLLWFLLLLTFVSDSLFVPRAVPRGVVRYGSISGTRSPVSCCPAIGGTARCCRNQSTYSALRSGREPCRSCEGRCPRTSRSSTSVQ
jgi:hypothetical protein